MDKPISMWRRKRGGKIADLCIVGLLGTIIAIPPIYGIWQLLFGHRAGSHDVTFYWEAVSCRVTNVEPGSPQRLKVFYSYSYAGHDYASSTGYDLYSDEKQAHSITTAYVFPDVPSISVLTLPKKEKPSGLYPLMVIVAVLGLLTGIYFWIKKAKFGKQ